MSCVDEVKSYIVLRMHEVESSAVCARGEEYSAVCA